MPVAIASLWEVSDGGTQALMTAFYGALQQPDITKAAALQAAQIALIAGNYTVLEGDTRNPLEWRERVEGDLPATVVDNPSHPYYWAPFILIGKGLQLELILIT